MSQFNLLDEKWLLVMLREEGEVKEVSLKELFKNAHNYRQLAGETSTQDFAVLRFLLAILHTVFTRFNVDGEPNEFDLPERNDEKEFSRELYHSWKKLWEKGSFPEIVNEYLEEHRDRFYLIDDDYPFFQFPGIEKEEYPYSSTNNNINKLNGRILEGDPRKPRIFMSQHQKKMNLSDAARWLIYINGYAPSKSGNPGKKKKRDSTGVAYLGKLGGLYASGNNLFETLMLNLNLPENAILQKPIWEIEPQINKYIEIPDNLAALFTYPSRQLFLVADEENHVISYWLDLAISNFEYAPNLIIEPFTLWREDNNLDISKWKVKEGIVPKRHNPEKYFWQEMQTFSLIEEKDTRPGIIKWLIRLQGDELVSGLISLNAVAENYIQKDGVVDQQIHDRISENIGLLESQENGWLTLIAEEIRKTEEVIKKTIVSFARDIDRIRNLKNSSTEIEVKKQIFFNIDNQFRNWLIRISPTDEKQDRILEWRIVLSEEINKIADQLIQGAGNRDYLGYYKDKGLENIEIAYNRFRKNLRRELGVKE